MNEKPIFDLSKIKLVKSKDLKQEMLSAKEGTIFWLDEETIAVIHKFKGESDDSKT